MSQLVHYATRPLHARVNIVHLRRYYLALKWAEKLILVAAGVIMLVIIFQLAYPRGRMRPFASFSGISVGWQKSSEVLSALESLNNQARVLSIAGRKYTVSAADSGVTIDVKKATAQLASYGWQQRLVPFSFLSSNTFNGLPVVIDHAKLSALAKKLTNEASIKPVDASLKQAKGNWVLVPGDNGRTIGVDEVEDSLVALARQPENQISLTGKIATPKISDATAKAALANLKQVAQHPPKISAGNETYPISSKIVNSWARFTANEKLGTLTLSFSESAIKDWASDNLPSVIVAPGTSVVKEVDGRVVSQTQGASGEGLDASALAADLSAGLLSGDKTIKAPTIPLAAHRQVSSSFTPTNAGLVALVRHWADSRGIKASVSFVEIGGQHRHASYNGGLSMPSASLYKLFVAWYVFRQVEDGKVKMDDSATEHKNVEQCLEAMIVVSDNPCGEYFGDHFGWNNIENFATSHGYSGASVNRAPTHNTASTVAKYLIDLQAGKLLNKDHTQQLLGWMGQQVYRQGIPSGIDGRVEDKVGFNPGIWDDAAIVRADGHSYVLVALTNATPSAIADLARQIQSTID